MATDPAFAATPQAGTPAILGAAETSLTVPVNFSTILTAGANGTLLTEIVVDAVTTSLTPTTVAGLVYIFLFDGTTNHLFDILQVTAVTASASTAPFRTSKTYTESIPTGWTIRASQSIAGNASLLKVIAFGGNY